MTNWIRCYHDFEILHKRTERTHTHTHTRTDRNVDEDIERAKRLSRVKLMGNDEQGEGAGRLYRLHSVYRIRLVLSSTEEQLPQLLWPRADLDLIWVY